VKAFTPHGLRLMVVDRMLRAGVDPATAALGAFPADPGDDKPAAAIRPLA
jgi:hypothetical protein